VLVTHKIHEVLAISDEVTVLRDARVTGRFRTAEATGSALVQSMTGREVTEVANAGTGEPGDEALQVTGLTVVDRGVHRVRDVSFTVRRGEIVGVAGVSGNGQREVVAAILGTGSAESGEIRLLGRDVASLDVRRRRAIGLAVVPEDRRGEGMAVTMTTAENLALGHHRTAPIGASRGWRRGWLSLRAQRDMARRLIADYDVRTSGERQPVGALSGGNAQKVVIARELSHRAPVLIAEQPTQGVDIGAIESIHQRLLDYRRDGGAVLLVSHEIAELQALADRVLVMFAGRIVAEYSRADATTARIGAAMAGTGESSRSEGGAS
jgi:ABC-type uncharacterized transport system ATPase subunit